MKINMKNFLKTPFAGAIFAVVLLCLGGAGAKFSGITQIAGPDPYGTTMAVNSDGSINATLAGSTSAGLATSANQNKGKALSQLAASVSGSINGLYITGANTIARIVGDNASTTTLYLQIFDSTTLPANGSTPIAEVTVGWGISTLPTENEEAFTPDWISTASGVYYVWSTTSGTLTAASSGTGLLVRIYGN